MARLPKNWGLVSFCFKDKTERSCSRLSTAASYRGWVKMVLAKAKVGVKVGAALRLRMRTPARSKPA